jgi:hypothetical protein
MWRWRYGGRPARTSNRFIRNAGFSPGPGLNVSRVAARISCPSTVMMMSDHVLDSGFVKNSTIS